MTVKELLDQQSFHTITRDLMKLETELLLKNTFLIETQELLNQCYDKNLELDLEGIKKLIGHLECQIDGKIESSFDLSNRHATVEAVCSFFKKMEYNQ